MSHAESGDAHAQQPARPERPEPKDSPTTPIHSESATLTSAGASLNVDGSFASQAAALGAHLNDFEVIGLLGRGGMGVVYKARQKSLDRIVAIKMLVCDQGREGLALARFQAEARAAAKLTHPNIVGIHQIGECVLGHYFAMEYIEGETLQEVLDKRAADNPVPINRAVNLMVAVADAVSYAHSKGVVHRDLKPGNIMIDKFKRPIVMDFGIAKVTGKGQNLTARGVALGTPAYMPPEQTGEVADSVGPHSDVYSLGAILYRLLTGRPVYQAETTLRTILLVIAPEMPPAVRDLRPEVPQVLNNICMKCLSKRPEDRYPDAGVLAQELRGVRSKMPGTSSSVTNPIPALPAVVLVCKETGKTIPLTEPANVIGRASDCQVVLKSADVSKRHCRILLRGDEPELEDLGSVNGTLVNGEPVNRVVLQDGDVLEVGDHRFVVRRTPPRR